MVFASFYCAISMLHFEVRDSVKKIK